jgi:hypothetical protein
MTFIEVLVASAICVLCLSVMIQLWAFSTFFTVQTTDNAVACDLARQTMETLKETGFSQTPEAPATAPLVHYFDVNTNNMDINPTTARYKVTTTVVSDTIISGSSPTTPAPNALRLVTTTVTLVSSGKTLATITTYFARNGI